MLKEIDVDPEMEQGKSGVIIDVKLSAVEIDWSSVK